MTEAIVDIVPGEVKAQTVTMSGKKIKSRYGAKGEDAPRDPDTADMFTGKKAAKPKKGPLVRSQTKGEAAPGDGEGPGWRDVEPPAKGKGKAKAKAKAEPGKKAKAKAPAKVKPAPAKKAAAKPKAPAKAKAKAPAKEKKTRVRTITPRTAILIRLTDAELAKLDKFKGKAETRPAAILRVVQDAIGAKPGK